MSKSIYFLIIVSCSICRTRDKNFVIRGSPDAVEKAKNMILDKLGMGGGGYGGGGYGGGSWGSGGGGYQSGYDNNAGGGNVNVNPQTGQADYSAQWADYYRSMGMVKEAEAIEAARVCTKITIPKRSSLYKYGTLI